MMKRMKICLAGMLAMTALMTGCGENSAQDAASADGIETAGTDTQYSDGANDSTDKPAADMESNADAQDVAVPEEEKPRIILSESDVLEDFAVAEEAYGWFEDLSRIAVNDEERFEATAENGVCVIYEKVNYIEFFNLRELRNFLSCYFPESTTDALLEKCVTGTNLPVFQEKEGVLYIGRYFEEADIPVYEAQYAVAFEEDEEGVSRAEISMACSMTLFDKTINDTLTYTMVLGEDSKWRVTEDFTLPMQQLMAQALARGEIDPLYLLAAYLPEDGIYVEKSLVADLNADGTPEVYLGAASWWDYYAFFIADGIPRHIQGTMWGWSSNLFYTESGNLVMYAEPHTVGTEGIYQYRIFEWGEEGYALKEELWQLPVEWEENGPKPVGFEYLASKICIDPFADGDYSYLLISEQEFAAKIAELGTMTYVFDTPAAKEWGWDYFKEHEESSAELFRELKEEVLDFT